MKIQYVLYLCASIAVLSAAFTRYYFPQLQSKTVEVTKEVVRTDVQTVVHTVTLPGGGTDTTTTTIDHSIRTETDKKQTTIIAQKNWLVSGSVNTDYRFEPPSYGIQAQRRILGPLYVGALLNTKHEVGLSIGFEF